MTPPQNGQRLARTDRQLLKTPRPLIRRDLRRAVQNFARDPSRSASGQNLGLTVMGKGKLVPIEPELMQQRGLEIVWRNNVLDRLMTKFVGCAMHHATANAAAS